MLMPKYQTPARKCVVCGKVTREHFVIPTEWQRDDPDCFESWDEQLIADGAEVLCLACLNAREAQ